MGCRQHALTRKALTERAVSYPLFCVVRVGCVLEVEDYFKLADAGVKR